MAKKPTYSKSAQTTNKPRKQESAGSSTKTGSQWEPAGWWKYALIAMAITAVLYLPSLKYEYVNWDDPANIEENPNLQNIDAQSIQNIFSIEKGNVIGNYNPLPIFTFALEKWAVGEFDPGLTHGINIVLHLLTLLFAMRVLLHLGFGIGGAFLGGMLFGIHPLRVESVAWATERKDVLFAVFFFAALMYYIRYLKSEGNKSAQTRYYVLAIVLALLSSFAKVQAVTLVLSMLVADYFLNRPFNTRMIIDKIPFAALSLIFGLINIYTLKVQGSTNDDVTNYSFIQRLCVGAYSLAVYCYKLFIPYPLAPLYAYPSKLPPEVYVAPVFALAFLGAIVYLYKRNLKIWVFGLLFFLFNVMFLLQIFGAGQGFLADRFTYVPYFGFFAIAAWYYDKYVQQEDKKTLVYGISGVFLLVFAVLTFKQVKIWENGETLWTQVMKLDDGSKTANTTAYWNRGQYRRDQGDYEGALKDYTYAITVNKNNPELFNSRGKTYFDMAMNPKNKAMAGDYMQKAMSDYTAGININNVKPKSKAEILINRGTALCAQGMLEAGLKDLNEGLTIDPANKNGYFNRSLAFYNMGKLDLAVNDYTEYLKYDPYNANVWYERGMLKRSLNQNDEAIKDLNQALKINSTLGVAYLERARAHAQAGRKAEAQKDYQTAQKYKINISQYDQQLLNK